MYDPSDGMNFVVKSTPAGGSRLAPVEANFTVLPLKTAELAVLSIVMIEPFSIEMSAEPPLRKLPRIMLPRICDSAAPVIDRDAVGARMEIPVIARSGSNSAPSGRLL